MASGLDGAIVEGALVGNLAEGIRDRVDLVGATGSSIAAGADREGLDRVSATDGTGIADAAGAARRRVDVTLASAYTTSSVTEAAALVLVDVVLEEGTGGLMVLDARVGADLMG